jgi:hypothetical protein
MKKGFFGGAQTKKQNCQLLCCCFCHFFNKKKTFLPRAVAANTQDLNFSGNLFDVYC